MTNVSAEAKWQERDLVMAEAFADDHPDWDGSFIESLRNYFRGRQHLTDKQYTALRNVLEKWRIEEWYEENYG